MVQAGGEGSEGGAATSYLPGPHHQRRRQLQPEKRSGSGRWGAWFRRRSFKKKSLRPLILMQYEYLYSWLGWAYLAKKAPIATTFKICISHRKKWAL